MTWTNRYWDIVDHFYWEPKYLGLGSISQKHWIKNEDTVAVPKEMTNPTGPLYRRSRSGDDYWAYVRGLEETFNHIFDLTFAILPGSATCQILNSITNRQDSFCFRSIGREIRGRYHWPEQSNITTPDGFFVADEAITAVELKFDAKTSQDQLAKYLFLLVCEEQKTGERPNLDLIYIFNADAVRSFEQQIGRKPDEVDSALLRFLLAECKNSTVTDFLQGNQKHAASVLNRLAITCIDWSRFASALSDYADGFGDSDGDLTLYNLIAGLVHEIERHPLSGFSGGNS